MPSERGERLHPISLLFGIGTTAWALLLVLLFSPTSSKILIALLFIPTVVSSLLKYLSFRYWLGPEEMVIREGILRRNERHIPYARIQNIDLIQNPIHRLFKVAVVRIETASGGRPEAVISVLTLPTIDDMRARVFSDRDEGTSPETREQAADSGHRPLLELGLEELVIFGAISNKGLVIIAAALGLASQSGFFQNPEWLEALLKDEITASSLVVSQSIGFIALVLIFGVVAIVIGLRLFSILWAILKFYGFHLDRHGEDLRTEYGLLTKITATLPRHRIQLVTVNLTPLHRLFARASIQVDTAGGGADQSSQGGVQERQWLAPVIERSRALPLLRQVVPEWRLTDFRWQKISPRAWRRLFVRRLVWLSIVLAAAFLLLGVWSLALAIPGIVLAVVQSQLYAERTGYALTQAAVLYRSGAWVRRVSIVPFAKIQALALRQTPFDRRRRMATVSVDTAGANLGGHRVAVAYLDLEAAHKLMARLDQETRRTAFKW